MYVVRVLFMKRWFIYTRSTNKSSSVFVPAKPFAGSQSYSRVRGRIWAKQAARFFLILAAAAAAVPMSVVVYARSGVLLYGVCYVCVCLCARCFCVAFSHIDVIFDEIDEDGSGDLTMNELLPFLTGRHVGYV